MRLDSQIGKRVYYIMSFVTEKHRPNVGKVLLQDKVITVYKSCTSAKALYSISNSNVPDKII